MRFLSFWLTSRSRCCIYTVKVSKHGGRCLIRPVTDDQSERAGLLRRGLKKQAQKTEALRDRVVVAMGSVRMRVWDSCVFLTSQKKRWITGYLWRTNPRPGPQQFCYLGKKNVPFQLKTWVKHLNNMVDQASSQSTKKWIGNNCINLWIISAI